MRVGLIQPYRWEDKDRSPEARMAYADVMLERANAHLASELNDSDILDNKALQLTVGDIAAFTILVSFKRDWVWTVPEILLGVAAFFFFLVYRPREWEIGPALEEFDPPDTPAAPAEAPAIKQAMADTLLWAVTENRKTNDRKSAYFSWGYRILGVGFALSFILAIADR